LANDVAKKIEDLQSVFDSIASMVDGIESISGGRQVKPNVNITYHITGVDSEANLERLLEEHDRKLFNDIATLIG